MKGLSPFVPDMLRPRLSAGLLLRLVRTTQARVARTPTTMPGKKPAKKTPAGKLLASLVGGGLFESMPDARLVGVEVTVALVVEVTLVVLAAPAFDLSRTQTLLPSAWPQVYPKGQH